MVGHFKEVQWVEPQPIVIDANNLIKRCIMQSALDDLKAGETFTGGVFGSLGLLASILKQPDFRASGVYLFFDGGVPAQRLKLLPDYKCKRAEAKKLLTDEQKERAYKQIDMCRDMFELLGVACAKYREREADDAIAAAVRIFVSVGRVPIVVSADRDLLQCVAMGGHVYNFKDVITRENFESLALVAPELFLLYKVLTGDPSDSIPGVAGCGKARALRMVEEFSRLYTEHATMSPYDQLAALRDVIATKPDKERIACEDAFLAGYDQILKEMRAVDLSNSFGGVNGLTAKLNSAPDVRETDFLRFCRDLKFGSVLGNPGRYVDPFLKAAKSRKSFA